MKLITRTIAAPALIFFFTCFWLTAVSTAAKRGQGNKKGGGALNAALSTTSNTLYSAATAGSRFAGARQSAATSNYESPWTYRCHLGEHCKRHLYNPNATSYHHNGGETGRVSLDVCWLTCGQFGAMWPYPTGQVSMGKSTTKFYPRNARVTNIEAPHKTVKAMMGYAGNIFLDHLFRMHPKSDGNAAFPASSGGKKIEATNITISLKAESSDTKISLNTNEKYTLKITSFQQPRNEHIHIEISAPTFFGVRHALETLTQLIAFDEENECLRIVSEASITDEPAFPYRGLMVDTGRNFIPMNYLKRLVDAMSYNKLNMLHWHITDTNSFPFYSKRVPQMTKYGAYSGSQIYTPKEIKELVLYARLRGVKIIPELDAPAHAGNGWQWGPLEGYGELAMCVNAEPWRSYCGQPPCGQLNPLNNNTYMVLGDLYKDLLEVFDRDIFHMGGDEIFFQCWYAQDEITNWQAAENSFDLMDLWGLFQERALELLKEANYRHPITPIVWTSDMTSRARHFLDPSQYIIQVWSSANSHEVRSLLESNYRIIMSNVDALYLDHGFGSWLGREHFWQYKTWQTLYDNDLIKIAQDHFGANATSQVLRPGLILGGEATLWSEKVDQYNMEMKFWPRSAAFAERMWSSPKSRTQATYSRLLHQRARMAKRGVHADRLQPESCHTLTGSCNDPYSRI